MPCKYMYSQRPWQALKFTDSLALHCVLSHGSRPKRACHSSALYAKTRWTANARPSCHGGTLLRLSANLDASQCVGPDPSSSIDTRTLAAQPIERKQLFPAPGILEPQKPATCESQSKPGSKVIYPKPCKESKERISAPISGKGIVPY